MRYLALVLVLLSVRAWGSEKFPCPTKGTQANVYAYKSVLTLEQAGGQLFESLMTRRLGAEAEREKLAANREEVMAWLTAMGKPGVDALSSIAFDGDEAYPIRKRALRMLMELPGAE